MHLTKKDLHKGVPRHRLIDDHQPNQKDQTAEITETDSPEAVRPLAQAIAQRTAHQQKIQRKADAGPDADDRRQQGHRTETGRDRRRQTLPHRQNGDRQRR